MAATSSLLVRSIPYMEALCPDQVSLLARESATERETRAVVLDQWGRDYALTPEFIFGREPVPNGLAMLEGSVSRRHARLLQNGEGAWALEDLDSTNGTFLDGHRVEGLVALGPSHVIVCGDVGVVFLADATRAELEQVTESIRATSQNRAVGDNLIRLAETSAGSGGIVTLAGVSVQLGSTQFALLRVLAERAIAEATMPVETRGYVRSIELMKVLPWEAANPQDNHVKQLVRRTRRALNDLHPKAVIESRQRFGYRLTIPPLIVG